MKATIDLRLDVETISRIDLLAAKEGNGRSAVIRRLLLKALAIEEAADGR